MQLQNTIAEQYSMQTAGFNHNRRTEARGLDMEDRSLRQAEEDVLAQLRGNDPDAARCLLDVFGDRVYGLALRILASEQDAKEAVQETFITVWEKWETFRGKSRFSSWIYRIAANCAYMRLRKRRRFSHEVSIEEFDHGAEHIDSAEVSRSSGRFTLTASQPDEALAQRELRSVIEGAVRSLSPTYRTAFMLKDIEGMSLKEIAEVMGLSEAAVKSRVHRARLEMRRKLNKVLDDRPSG